MLKVVVFFCLSAFSTAAIAVTPSADYPMVKKYRKLLLQNPSGGHTDGFGPGLRKEFLSEAPIAALLHHYRKSLRHSGHPVTSPSRALVDALYRLYAKHLIEIALRSERTDLNRIVEYSRTGDISRYELETRHMQILGIIYDDVSIDVTDAYRDKDLEKMKKYGAISLYVLTEAIIRLALFDMEYRSHLKPIERITHIITKDQTDALWELFKRRANITDHSIEAMLQVIERFAGVGMAELLPEYQGLIANDKCEALLSARHPSGEG